MPRPKKRPNRYSIIVFIIGIFIFVEILIIFPRTLEKAEEDTPLEQAPTANQFINQNGKSSIEQKMLGVHLVENGLEQKAWELFAQEANGSADANWTVKKLKVHFFSSAKSQFTVEGDIGEVDGESKNMMIRGQVTTTSSNGYLFKTHSLKYLSEEKLMISPDPVSMKGPPDQQGKGFELTGNRLRVDLVKDKMEILEKIAAHKTMNGKSFSLTSDRASFSNKNQEAIFAGNVDMKLGDDQVRAPIAYFIYSKTLKSFDKIILKQGVRLTSLDKQATCQELEISLFENKMTLRGQPKVQQGEDEIQGEEIVFLDGGKKVKINRVSIKGKNIEK